MSFPRLAGIIGEPFGSGLAGRVRPSLRVLLLLAAPLVWGVPCVMGSLLAAGLFDVNVVWCAFGSCFLCCAMLRLSRCRLIGVLPLDWFLD